MARLKRKDMIFSKRKNRYRFKYRFKPRFFLFLALLILIIILLFSLILQSCEERSEGGDVSSGGGQIPTGGGETPSKALEINLPESFTMVVGSNVERYIKTGIDPSANAEISIEGEYDASTPGDYQLRIIATPAEGKKAEKVVNLTIADPADGGADFSFVTETGAKGERIDGASYVEGTLIVNHTFSLPESYNPGGLTDEAAEAFYILNQDASAAGVSVYYASGYRSHFDQQSAYSSDVENYGQYEAEKLISRPGYSEHQTGLAIDVNNIDVSFAETEGGYWLTRHAHEYGYIIRFPEGDEGYTDIYYEPWHIRYVGKELAEKLYLGDGEWMSLEEYFGIPSKYRE